MEDRETPQMRKFGASKTTRIIMATVLHVTSGSGLRKFQAGGFLLGRVYMHISLFYNYTYCKMLTLLFIVSYILSLLLFIKNYDEFCIVGLYRSM